VKKIINIIEKLKKSEIRAVINDRIKEFEKFQSTEKEQIFKELCFCIMTANCGAEKCIEIHDKIKDDFLQLTEIELSKRFKKFGYRFPNVRANYIIIARKKMDDLKNALQNLLDENLRLWITKNILGLGYKETSHFLRNIGYKNYAIVDFHIVDLLEKYKLIEKPKTMSKKNYLKIEKILEQIAIKSNLSLAELDLYLWYLETGKILK